MGCLWSKFQLSQTFITRVIVQKPQKLSAIESQRNKSRDIRKAMSRMANTQKLKLMDPETMDRRSHNRLCENLC